MTRTNREEYTIFFSSIKCSHLTVTSDPAARDWRRFYSCRPLNLAPRQPTGRNLAPTDQATRRNLAPRQPTGRNLAPTDQATRRNLQNAQWWSILSIAAQRALALSLTEVDSEAIKPFVGFEPKVGEILADVRYEIGPIVSRLPLRG